jgi:PTS system nitrogen regulatory IIA component
MDFDALDGKRVRIFFAVVAPEDEPGVHLKMLARISRLVRSESFREAVLNADSAPQIMAAIEHAEAGIV